MKKSLAAIVFALALSFLALPAAAQESYSLPATSGQVAIVDAARIAHNVNVCGANGLAANCTQAQLDAAPSPKQGWTVYADSLAGRQAFVRSLVAASILGGSVDRVALRRFRWAGMMQAQRDAYCASLGESAGCDPFAGN